MGKPEIPHRPISCADLSGERRAQIFNVLGFSGSMHSTSAARGLHRRFSSGRLRALPSTHSASSQFPFPGSATHEESVAGPPRPGCGQLDRRSSVSLAIFSAGKPPAIYLSRQIQKRQRHMDTFTPCASKMVMSIHTGHNSAAQRDCPGSKHGAFPARETASQTIFTDMGSRKKSELTHIKR